MSRIKSRSRLRHRSYTESHDGYQKAQIETIKAGWHLAKATVFLIRPFDAQFDAVETAVTDAAKACSLLVATSTNIQDQLKWIENVEYGILAARLVVAICSPYRTPTRSARQAPFNKINENVFYELGRAQAVGKPTLILAANIDALPSDVKSLNILKYDADNVSISVDKITGKLRELHDYCENELVDKRAQDIKSLRGVPAALARPEFLAYLGDTLYITLEYGTKIQMLETYIKTYRNLRATAEQSPGSSFPKYLIKQYVELTPNMLRALVQLRERHLKIPDDFVGACDEFRKAFVEADDEIWQACSEISAALAYNLGVNNGIQALDQWIDRINIAGIQAIEQWIDRINIAVGIISHESANILRTVHNIIQEGGKHR